MKEELLLLEYKKRCPRCGEYGGKDGCGFHIEQEARGGLGSRCRKCNSIYMKEYRKNNQEKIKGKHTLYKKKNREKIKKRKALYRKNNQEKIRYYNRDYHRDHYKNNREKGLKRSVMRCECLTDGYIKERLTRQVKGRKESIKKLDITPEMIELKRMQLKFFRELKKGREALNELH